MVYGYIDGENIVAPVNMTSRFGNIGAWHTLTDEERAVHGWYPCEVIGEGYDPRLQIRSEAPVLEFDGEKITATYQLTDRSIADIKDDLLDSLGQIRYAKEVENCSREDRFILKDKIDYLKAADIESIAWKWNGEWRQATSDDLQSLWLAIGLHIDKCYLAESEVFKIVLNAESREDAADLDVKSLFDEAFAALA